MPIDPVKIPQNVYVEDRIIGPITLRSLILLMLGGGFSYVIWTILRRIGFAGLIPTVIAWTPAVIAAAFAFVKINGISLLRFLFLMVEGTQKPPNRYWQPRTGITLNIHRVIPSGSAHKEMAEEHPQEDIRSLSSALDLGYTTASAPVATPDDADDPLLLPSSQRPTAAPVRPERIVVEPRSGASVDTVQARTVVTAAPAAPTMIKDILPPPATHA